MPRILAPATVGPNATRQIGQAKNIVEFAIREQSSVGGDATAVEFQLQPPIKINPQRAVIRFTRRVFDEPTTMTNATY
jgi:hypothetical protein